MKTSYSRRELYALGEPIGDSSTYELAGRRVYGGGGGGGILGGIGDAISDIGGGVSDAISGVAEGVSDAGSGLDDFVNEEIPGGWALPIIATAAAYGVPVGPELLGEAGAAGAGAGGGSMFSGLGELLGPELLSGPGAGAGGLGSIGSGLGELFGSGAPELLGEAGGYGPGASNALSELFGPVQLSGPGAGGLGSIGSAVGNLFGGGGSGSGGGGGGLTLGGAGLGAAGLAGLMKMLKDDSSRYGVPGRQDNVGPMSQFKYDPSKFTASRPDPAMFRPRGAPTAQIGYGGMAGGMGGGMGGMGGGMGGGQGGFVINQLMQMQMQAQRPGMADMGGMGFAQGGGISTLGGYSDGGRLLKGPGDGMSDNIPAKIGSKQPARLADGEFVVPADVVSHLGNGSTDAGAKQLYKMMDKIRAARTGRKAQGKEIKADKFLPK